MAHERVLLAMVGAAHGVKGEVRLKSFTADPMGLGDYLRLIAEDGRSFKIERLRPAKTMLVAKFRGIEDRNAAEALNGIHLYAERSDLPPPDDDEFYHADLIGMNASDEAGESLGTVTGVHDFGAGDILEIAPRRGQSLLVPFTRAAVPVVDIANQRLVVVPPVEAEDDAEQGADREKSTP